MRDHSAIAASRHFQGFVKNFTDAANFSGRAIAAAGRFDYIVSYKMIVYGCEPWIWRWKPNVAGALR